VTSSDKSGGSVGFTGPVQNLGGTAGHLPDGYQLRDFRIERVVGEGGFSVVYLATDLRLEREVAIKEYMPTALATRNADLSVQVRASAHHREAFDAGLRSFINEAKLLAHFEHRALVKVHQFWQERGTAYMVMPHYSGPTLKSWIKQQHGRADADWLELFFYLLMDALETLHRENCLHRDVAPDNILVIDDGSPLLLDFGAARRVIGDLTQALTVILKPGFAPIEQYAESASMRQGPWTDVYALCAVAHFMITGKAPTPAVSRVLADDLVPLSVTAAGRFPPAFLVALDAGLTVRPQQRPQNIGALRALIEGAAPDNTLTAPPAGHADWVTPPAALLPTFAPPDGDDDEKTQLVTGSRESVPPARPGTVSPNKPASFPLDAEATGGATEPQAFEPRFPSRSMREQAATDGNERFAWLPLVIGGVQLLRSSRSPGTWSDGSTARQISTGRGARQRPRPLMPRPLRQLRQSTSRRLHQRRQLLLQRRLPPSRRCPSHPPQRRSRFHHLPRQRPTPKRQLRNSQPRLKRQKRNRRWRSRGRKR